MTERILTKTLRSLPLVLLAILAPAKNVGAQDLSTEAKITECLFETQKRKVGNLDQQEREAARQEIVALKPALESGSRKEFIDHVQKSRTKLEVSQFDIPEAAGINLDGYAGVRVLLLEHKQNKQRKLVLQTTDTLTDTYSKTKDDFGEYTLLFSEANGSIVSVAGKYYLLTNAHVLDTEKPNLYGDLGSVDFGLVEIPKALIPSSLKPFVLDDTGDEEITGKPFFIAGIKAESSARDLSSLSVVGSFAIPLPMNMYNILAPGRFAVSNPKDPWVLGGLHTDCTPQRTLKLGGLSGSPAFDYEHKKLLGVFSGGIAMETETKGEFIKMIMVIPTKVVRQFLGEGKYRPIELEVEFQQ